MKREQFSLQICNLKFNINSFLAGQVPIWLLYDSVLSLPISIYLCWVSIFQPTVSTVGLNVHFVIVRTAIYGVKNPGQIRTRKHWRCRQITDSPNRSTTNTNGPSSNSSEASVIDVLSMGLAPKFKFRKVQLVLENLLMNLGSRFCFG